MHSILFFASFLTIVLASVQLDRRSCSHDNCLRAFIKSSADASKFCATYTDALLSATPTLPPYAAQCTGDASRISSACSCITTAAVSSRAEETSTSTKLTTSTSVPAPTSTSVGTPCTCTAYSQIAPAVASCTNIKLQDIVAPSNSSIDLSKLLPNTVVTFAGKTTFAFTNSSSFDSMTFSGQNVTITSEPGAVLDGNGQLYWDGLGSNGGVPKPNHFIAVKKMTAGSVIKNLRIENWPVHLFSISGCSDLTFQNLILDNTAGEAPNNRSNGLAAAHNSDGFDLSSSNNVLITDSTVLNQDDCVAITSGNNVTVSNMYCSGGHGLSIGSVGGKSNNNVTNILFTNSQIINSENGARIKANYNTTGFISNITYSNIFISGATIYGIDVQEDYLNGGPTGTPSNGVIIQNVLFSNVTGTATAKARDYYVLCGEGSCSNFVFEDVSITGGGKESSCNFPEGGCPA